MSGTADEVDPGSVLTDAVEMEAQGKEFYERASARMRNPRAKDMFTSLVRQEQMHIDILEGQLSRLAHDKAWAPLKQLIKEASAPKASVFQDKDIKKIELDPGAGELDVISLGMTIEKKSVEYYRDAGAKATDKNAKKILNWLVAQETGHLTVLQAEYDYRTRSGFYMGEPEFSLEIM